MWKSLIAALCAVSVLAGGQLPAAANEPDDGPFVTVKRGDSLHRLASRHHVSVEDLTEWNKEIIGKKLVIRVGDKLRVGPPGTSTVAAAPPKAKAPEKETATPKGPTWSDHVTVRRGDTIGRIARREGVSVEDLLEWNGLTSKARIRAGQLVEIQRPGKKPSSASIGRAVAGTVKHSVWLDKGPGYRLRFPKNAYGTEETVAILKSCAKKVHDRFDGTADILYGDLSRPRGGKFPPHESHQSGRDADVGYYLAGNVQNATMHRVGAHEVDYTKSWALLRCYLRTGKVVRVYMDTKIQTAMATHLGTTGQASPALLSRLFEVIGGSSALVQHAPKHDTHLHVRFACARGDAGCVLEASERPWTTR